MITQRLENCFASDMKLFKNSLICIDRLTNIHYLMFSISNQALHECFHEDIDVSGNSDLTDCEEILDFVEQYILGDYGVVIHESGQLTHTYGIGLSEDKIEEALYIWDKIIKTENLLSDYVYHYKEECSEAIESCKEYIHYLNCKLLELK